MLSRFLDQELLPHTQAMSSLAVKKHMSLMDSYANFPLQMPHSYKIKGTPQLMVEEEEVRGHDRQ